MNTFIYIGLSWLCAMESFWHARGDEMLGQTNRMTFYYFSKILKYRCLFLIFPYGSVPFVTGYYKMVLIDAPHDQVLI